MDRLLRKNPDHRYANELHLFVKDAQGACVCLCACVGLGLLGCCYSSTVALARIDRCADLALFFPLPITSVQPSRIWPWVWAWAWG